MLNSFKKDLYRYYGREKETFKEKLLRPMELKYLYVYRRIQASNRLMKVYYQLKLRRLSKKTQIQIPWNTEIGEGFYIGHCGRIIINSDAKLGKNVNIATGVTIGRENRGKRKGCPTIGDKVWIGTNSVIVGSITIGEDVLIAPLSYVNFDVPAHSIVIGNPAKIISREGATKDYVNRTV